MWGSTKPSSLTNTSDVKQLIPTQNHHTNQPPINLIPSSTRYLHSYNRHHDYRELATELWNFATSDAFLCDNRTCANSRHVHWDYRTGNHRAMHWNCTNDNPCDNIWSSASTTFDDNKVQKQHHQKTSRYNLNVNLQEDAHWIHKTWQQAMKHPKWRAAMLAEFNS